MDFVSKIKIEKYRIARRMVLLTLLTLILFVLVLIKGEVDLSIKDLFFSESEKNIVLWNFRLPLALGALFGGVGLSISGLVMQSVFRNPLAGPFVLGVSSGASLGVALVSIAGIAVSFISVLPAALLGAFFVILFVFSCSRFIKSKVAILIVGLMVGYLADAVVSLILFYGEANALRGFFTWGMGSFGRINPDNMGIFILAVLFGILPICFCTRYLNFAIFGDNFVRDHGISVKFYRWVSLLSASFLAAIVTAFCGPIAFLGLAIPHLAFGIFRTTNHAVLVPATALTGASVSLLVSFFPYLPLQSLMSIIGAPVVLWILLSSGRKHYG